QLVRLVHPMERGRHVRDLLEGRELSHLAHEVLVVHRAHGVLVLQLGHEQLQEVVLAHRRLGVGRRGRAGRAGTRGAGRGRGGVDGGAHGCSSQASTSICEPARGIRVGSMVTSVSFASCWPASSLSRRRPSRPTCANSGRAWPLGSPPPWRTSTSSSVMPCSSSDRRRSELASASVFAASWLPAVSEAEIPSAW